MVSILPSELDKIKTWLGNGSINIFGLPFSGKDTHGHRLAEIFDASLLGGGQILRNSQIPPHVKELIDSGHLAPTEDYVKIVLPYLSSPEFTGRPMILSSVGRWHGEETGVLKAAEDSGHPIKAAVYLHLSEDIAHQRFIRAKEKGDRETRSDDAEINLATRFQEFHDKTLPVIEFYRQHNLLIEVDGRPPVESVSSDILSKLLQKAKS